MTGLPHGWAADYDGRRWFYTYRPTGHVQYSFPNEGDEFPHFVDAFAPAPDLAPEERLESEQQVRRQSEAVPCAKLSMSPPAPSARNSWKPDVNSAPELRVEVSPPPPAVFDPVGILAEMPTEDTPASRIEMHPQAAELGDNSVLAPIEREAAAAQQLGLQRPSSDSPSYQPYTPDPHGTYLRPDKRTTPGAAPQRDVSLMMSLKLPGNLEPSAVPRVLSPPQMPPKVPLQQEDSRHEALPVQDALAAPAPAGSDSMKITLNQLTQFTAAPSSYSPFLHPHGRTQSQGALSKFPSVLKPARGRISATPAQLQSLSAQKRSSAPSPASWKTTWEATPPPRVTAPPAYVPYQKGPDDSAEKAPQAEGPSRQSAGGEADSSVRQSPPSTPPPPPPQGPGSVQQPPGPAGAMSPEQAARLASTRSLRDVSPIRSASTSFCSRNPIRTPSPVESSLRSPSNASLRQGPNGTAYLPSSSSVPHLPASSVQLATQEFLQGTRGPTVPDKIPLEHSDEACLPGQEPALGSGGCSRGASDASSLSVPLRYTPDDYSLGFQVKQSSAQRRTASPPSHQDSAASTLHYKLGRIDEDGERGAAAEPKIVPQSTAVVSVASSTKQSSRISSLQAQTFTVSARGAAKEDVSQSTPRQSSSPPRKLSSEQSSPRTSPHGSLRGMPSIRLIHSREAAQTVPATFGQPLKSHPVGKTPVLTVEPLQDVSPAPAGKLSGTEKEKKWTKWFKSSRLSRSQKEQAHFGSMLGADNVNQLATRAADGQIV